MTDPSQNIESERALLACALQAPRSLASVREVVTAGDFYQNRHQVIYEALSRLADSGVIADPVRVLGEIERAGKTRAIGGAPYLAELYALSVVTASIPWYAEQLRNATGTRALEQVIARLDQIRRQHGHDYDQMMTLAAHETIKLEQIVDHTGKRPPIEALWSWEDFLAVPDRDADWVIPKFIERKDVWLLLGSEGGGKSWLSRQIAQAVAAGIHPFRPHQRIEAQRTLLVDIENPESMVRRQSRGLHHQITRLGTWHDKQGYLWMHPAGLNLRKRDDQQLLEQVIAETEPALVCFGSLYKAYTQGSDSWEAAAEEVRAVFDRLRATYDIALWLEHHMPKGDGTTRPLQPFGSSVWMRWAGFGRVINRVGDNVYELATSFRGDRDVRDVPIGLYRGGELPWAPIWDPDELDHLREKRPAGAHR